MTSAVASTAPARTASILRILLTLLAVAGVAAAIYRFAFGLRSVANINNAYPWGLWAGGFMALIALGGAGFTMAAIIEIFGFTRFKPFCRPSIALGLVCYLTYVVILMIELGRPWMGWRVLLVYQHTSPLYEIAICAMLYTTCLFIEFGHVAAESRGLRTLSRVIGAIYLPVVIIGVSLSHLHQSTLGTTLNIVPLKLDARWWSELLPFQFLLTAYMAGIGVVMIEHVVYTWFAGKRTRVDLLGQLGGVLAVLCGIYLVLRIGVMLALGHVPSMFRFDGLTRSLWVEIIGGCVLPFVMLLMPQTRRSRGALFFASALVVGGVVLHRINITVFAMRVKSWETYTPAFGEIITTLGAYSLGVLTYVYLVRKFPIHHLDTEPAAGAGGDA